MCMLMATLWTRWAPEWVTQAKKTYKQQKQTKNKQNNKKHIQQQNNKKGQHMKYNKIKQARIQEIKNT